MTLNLARKDPLSVFIGRPLSPSMLARFQRCELLFLVEDEDEPPTPAERVGLAAHALVLEGRKAFESRFTVGGPINKQTGKPFGADTIAVHNFEEKSGTVVITEKQAATVEEMARSVSQHHWAASLLAVGHPEVWISANYCGLPCHGRVDFENRLGVVDYKTCDDLDDFEPSMRRFRYAYQMAFYRAIKAKRDNKQPTDIECFLIASEKRQPYRVGVWRIGQMVLGMAQTENEEAISRLKRCVQLNKFSSGYEEVREFDYL